jgi:Tol biopolymer transport system component
MPMKRLRSDTVAMAVMAVITVTLGILVIRLRPQVVPLRVMYIASGASGVPELWAVIPGKPDTLTQLTFTEGGVYDYAPSPDGRKIAYAERDLASNRTTLKLLDLDSGAVTLLSDCIATNADCHTPVWRPDGSALAYVRTQYDPVLGAGDPKIWMIEGIESGALSEYGMFDAQTVGSQPVWSADGQRLAFYEQESQGVLVYDFAPDDPTQNFSFFPADNGLTGALSPDGRVLVTSALEAAGEHEEGETAEEHAAHADAGFRPGLIVGDVESGETRPLLPEGLPSDGQPAAWHPDGKRIALLRPYLEGGASTQGQQVYLYDIAAEALEPLIVDTAYNHGALSFSPDGGYLLFQRYSFETTRPQIWLFEMATGALTQLADEAYIAAWLPGTG